MRGEISDRESGKKLIRIQDLNILSQSMIQLFQCIFPIYDVKVEMTECNGILVVSNSFIVSIVARQGTFRTTTAHPPDRQEVRQTRQKFIKIHTIALSVRVNNRAQAALKRH